MGLSLIHIFWMLRAAANNVLLKNGSSTTIFAFLILLQLPDFFIKLAFVSVPRICFWNTENAKMGSDRQYSVCQNPFFYRFLCNSSVLRSTEEELFNREKTYSTFPKFSLLFWAVSEFQTADPPKPSAGSSSCAIFQRLRIL